jgi:hypothetical protein
MNIVRNEPKPIKENHKMGTRGGDKTQFSETVWYKIPPTNNPERNNEPVN